MARPLEHITCPQTILVAPFREYLVTRERDTWFIEFDGEQFGPYNTEREALLFAIDAAHNLGDKGELTRVLSRDEAGEDTAAWTYGHDPYPSGL
jgi:hypothetical protein